MVVDHQSHWYPPAYFEALLGRSGYPRAEHGDHGGFRLETGTGRAWDVPPSFFDLEQQVRDMDENGIDVMVLSPGAFGGDTKGLDRDEAIATMSLLNAEMGRAQELHPARVVGLAVPPMDNPPAALELPSEAVEELGLRGVSLVSNIDGRSVADSSMLEIYRRIEALGVPLFLHPAQRSVAVEANYSPIIEMGLGWMFDTSAAALALVYSGVLDECPDLTVVHPHLGGTLPYVADRVMAQARYVPSNAAEPLTHYLRERFYTDSVGMTPSALSLALETYGADRVLFGTDYPWLGRADGRRFVETSAPDSATAIIERNRVPGLLLAS